MPVFNKVRIYYAFRKQKLRRSSLQKTYWTVNGYHSYFASAEKKGYSGVCIYSKEEPEKIETGFGIEEYDSEGRILIAYYKDFVLFNIYFPNGKASKERLDYKMNFYDAFLEIADKLKKTGQNIIVCGDVNTAHTEIDLARPKENETYIRFSAGGKRLDR